MCFLFIQIGSVEMRNGSLRLPRERARGVSRQEVEQIMKHNVSCFNRDWLGHYANMGIYHLVKLSTARGQVSRLNSIGRAEQ